MAVCFDNNSNSYVYCTSSVSTYVAVGVIIPLAILIVIAFMYGYLRYRRRQLMRAQQQTYLATIIPVYNNDERQQGPYNNPYPPHYTSMSEDAFGKPPSYEQTIQQISETNNNNNNNFVQDPPGILPVTTSSTGPVESTRLRF